MLRLAETYAERATISASMWSTNMSPPVMAIDWRSSTSRGAAQSNASPSRGRSRRRRRTSGKASVEVE